MSNVLEVSNVGKSFHEYSSELHRVASWFGFNLKPVVEHQILDGINFSLSSGEAVGIVGRNGAGKSTLLKMITGTLKPTRGNIKVIGRISAILELGMGFHPDLTGRQNAYHSAGLMGFTQQQIDSVINDLEAFAEIGEYFDQPVRTYSSGMQMRVAFAVVTAFRPEILIVDEALSVGDAYFQHKSLNRIREFQKQGTTLLFVSHDKGSIQAVCDRAILLEKGTIIKDGNPEEVMDFYNALIAQGENNNIEQIILEDGKVQTISGTKEAIVEKIGLYNSEGKRVEIVGVGEPIELKVKIRVNKKIESLVLGYSIKDRLGQVMYGTNTWHTQQIIKCSEPGDAYEFSISFPANLGPGSYSIQTALVDSDNHLTNNYEWRDLAVVFNVVNRDKKQFIGCNWNEPIIKVSSL
ncbi:ABC transporter ATP-binding protein [Vibrio cholerae]|uniref:ABC transporter ATP-binding protein n=1 Tax=Vibrio cholerae TaxID=666 RepID=UPI0011D6BF1E|nr:ABC transporter ATP-binding protein [Vibrio cholerae]EGR0581296.1 ABC transporter ATP-binding protein [Vibrio cholerae]TXY76642.1 ABC transporter ATP-binding protein [Vibrio cholerae]BCN21215.1 putative O-antigen export system, ATP binding protein [Vibrio cholerae]BCN21878.1 putative O-antigen export system, ATP binding protein [Vibrio cholerae]GHX92009.1 ABC transporter family protein [Vibrio cholerae]